jgi:NAD(P)-dependent dehydrogenase (short-subunit alcohol dehydrogenase family)
MAVRAVLVAGASRGIGAAVARELAAAGERVAVHDVRSSPTRRRSSSARLAGPRGDEIRAENPFGRTATPVGVARAVLYLASPEAEFASGTTLDVNGASYRRL